MEESYPGQHGLYVSLCFGYFIIAVVALARSMPHAQLGRAGV